RPIALPDPLPQDVAGDRKQPGPDAGVTAEPLDALERGDEAALDQLLRLVADLAGEEAIERVEVAAEQFAARLLVSVAPGCEQLHVRPHAGEGNSTAVRADKNR